MKASPPDLSVTLAFERARIYRSAQLDQLDQYVYLAGRFKLLERIGEGSYGTVFLAEDRELARKVAVKIMPIGDPEVAEREGKMLAALEHPNVVRIYDHGSRDDYRWLVLEHLDGPTLLDWATGQSTRAILARYIEAGEGLDAAHRRGLVHRDFKPGNVRLNHKGTALVLDFGLARNQDSLHGESDARDTVYGTCAYMAPECLRGQTSTERGDQFAFCVSLWEALSGQNPFAFHGRDLEARARAVEAVPRGLETIPRRLRKPLRRGMAVLPGDRWPTMGRLLDALRGAQRPRRQWWLAGALTFVSLGTLLWARAPSPSRTVAGGELPGASAMAMEVLLSVERSDPNAIMQALWFGYQAARREGREADFLPVAFVAARYLETEGHRLDAADAWWITVRLSRDSHNAVIEAYATAKVDTHAQR